MIKEGYSSEADSLLQAKRRGSDWISDMEKQEREKTGIKNLRINYNRVFGYYIEVTKSYLDLVPENYMRKQTLANCESILQRNSMTLQTSYSARQTD